VIVLFGAALMILAAIMLAVSVVALAAMQILLPLAVVGLLVFAPWRGTRPPRRRRRRGRKVWP
jgi:membrane protein implicated in regulation of membrane protease activity